MAIQQQIPPSVDYIKRDGSFSLFQEWQIAAALCLTTLICLMAGLFDTVSAIVLTWYHSVTFNHGFLVLPVCAYVVWERRNQLLAIRPRVTFAGLVPLFIAALGWLVGFITSTPAVEETALVVMLQATVLTTLGWDVTRALMFPLFYLFFAVPVGEPLVPPLQELTATFSVRLLSLVGIPVFSDGLFISTPSNNWLVAEACSGIRYLIASFAIGTLFAALFYRSWWRRIVFCALSLIIPVIANGIRAFGIIAIAYVTDNELAVGVDHILYGWIFFSLVTILLLSFGMLFREPSVGDPIAAFLARPSLARPSPTRRTVMAVICVLGLVFVVRVAAAEFNRSPTDSYLSALSAPALKSTWASVPGASEPWPPKFARADREGHEAYTDGSTVVHAYIGYYASQRHGAEAVSSSHVLVDENVWTIRGRRAMRGNVGGHVIAVNQLALTGRRLERELWYWYWVDGIYVANPYAAKFLQAKAKLLGGEKAAAIIVVVVDHEPGKAEEAERAVKDFLKGLSLLTPPDLRGPIGRY